MSYQPIDIRRIRQQNIMSGYGYDDGGSNGYEDYTDNPVDPYQQQQEDGTNPDLQQAGRMPSSPLPTPIAPAQPSHVMTPAQRIEQMNQYFTPETRASLRLNNLLDNAPKREPPSFARTIVAAGMGLSDHANGIKNGLTYMELPYQRDMADWKEKAAPFQQAATLENQQNVNERTLAGNMINADTQYERNQELVRNNDLKNEIALNRNRIDMIKAQMGKGFSLDARNGSTVKIFNQTTGELQDTGIPTNWMSEADKVNAEGQWKVRAAEASGTAAIQRAEVVNQGAMERANVSGAGDILIDGKLYRYNATGGLDPVKNAPEGKVTLPGVPGRGSSANTLENIRAEQEKMKDLYELTPENRKYITKDINNGKFTLGNRPIISEGNMFGRGKVTQADVDAWDAVKKHIDPSYSPPIADEITLKPNQYGGPQNQGPTQTQPQTPQKQSTNNQPDSANYQGYNYGNYMGPREPTQRQGIGSVVKDAMRPTDSGGSINVYGQHVRPGYVWMQDTSTGQGGWMPENNASKAEQSGKYIRAK
jgi:hypothetical protein